MAVYREPRPRRVLFIALGILALLLVILGVMWTLRPRASAPADPLAAARAKALEAAQGLEIFSIHYPKRFQEPSFSGSALSGPLSAAQEAFDSARPELERLDPVAVEEIAKDFAVLKDRTASGARPEDVLPVAKEARDRLLVLSRAR